MLHVSKHARWTLASGLLVIAAFTQACEPSTKECKTDFAADYQAGVDKASLANNEAIINGTAAGTAAGVALTPAQGDADGYSDGYKQGYDDTYLNAYNSTYSTYYNSGYYNGSNSLSACLDGSSHGQSEGAADGSYDGAIQGYADGEADGYELGLLDGNECLYGLNGNTAEDKATCMQKGYDNTINGAAYANAYATAFASARLANAPYMNAYNAARPQGVTAGRAQGVVDGQYDGSVDGYDDGYADGAGDTYTVCYNNTYPGAYNNAYSYSYNSNYDIGFADGYDAGYEDGSVYCATAKASASVAPKAARIMSKETMTLKARKAKVAAPASLRKIKAGATALVKRTIDMTAKRAELRAEQKELGTVSARVSKVTAIK